MLVSFRPAGPGGGENRPGTGKAGRPCSRGCSGGTSPWWAWPSPRPCSDRGRRGHGHHRGHHRAAVQCAGRAGPGIFPGREVFPPANGGEIVTNPLIIGCACGLLVNLSGLGLPTLLFSPVDSLASAATPVALIGLGASFHVERLSADRRAILVGVLAKTGVPAPGGPWLWAWLWVCGAWNWGSWPSPLPPPPPSPPFPWPSRWGGRGPGGLPGGVYGDVLLPDHLPVDLRPAATGPSVIPGTEKRAPPSRWRAALVRCIQDSSGSLGFNWTVASATWWSSMRLTWMRNSGRSRSMSCSPSSGIMPICSKT